MEPWLTGTLGNVPPLQAAVLYSLQQARDDLRLCTEGLSDEELWRREGAIASVGFHIRHLAGSVERLMTYGEGRQLTGSQLEELQAEEDDFGPGRVELLEVLERKLENARQTISALDPATFTELREVGRKRVLVPLGVLLCHISEHTQRHTGAAIVTAKMSQAKGRPRHSEG